MLSQDLYEVWRLALAEGRSLSLEDAGCGFFRRKMGKKGGFLPVAVWHDGGKVMCAFASKVMPFDDIRELVIVQATSEEAYRRKMAGDAYPDEYPVRGAIDPSDVTTDAADAAPIRPRKRITYGHPEKTPDSS